MSDLATMQHQLEVIRKNADANARNLIDQTKRADFFESGYRSVYETLKECDVYGTGGDATSCAREAKMRLSEKATAIDSLIAHRDALQKELDDYKRYKAWSLLPCPDCLNRITDENGKPKLPVNPCARCRKILAALEGQP